MLIFEKQFDLKAHLSTIAAPNTSLGFVPTMGALHEGHLSLILQSLKENEHTIMSIFVNPTQFNNNTDLEKYPRTLEADVEKLEAISNKIIVYAPSVDDIYEGKTVSQVFDFDGLENQMEGKFRPGHFNGVGTIVKRLFEIVNPTHAYFGEKDFQQLQIVKKLVEKQKLAVKIIGNPIYREANGLAMSSRNERLTINERNKAAILFKILNLAKEKFKTESANEVKLWVEKRILTQTDYKIDYFEIADETTLMTCKRKIKSKKYRAFIAVFVNEIRLIDTITLN